MKLLRFLFLIALLFQVTFLSKLTWAKAVKGVTTYSSCEELSGINNIQLCKGYLDQHPDIKKITLIPDNIGDISSLISTANTLYILESVTGSESESVYYINPDMTLPKNIVLTGPDSEQNVVLKPSHPGAVLLISEPGQYTFANLELDSDEKLSASVLDVSQSHRVTLDNVTIKSSDQPLRNPYSLIKLGCDHSRFFIPNYSFRTLSLQN